MTHNGSWEETKKKADGFIASNIYQTVVVVSFVNITKVRVCTINNV